MRCLLSNMWNRFLKTHCSSRLALILMQLLTAAKKCKYGSEHSYMYICAGYILGHNKLPREFLIWVQTMYANYMVTVLTISMHTFNLHF